MPILVAEAEKLWQQTFFSCNNLVEMMAGYVMVGVPGDPLPRLRKLAGRLNEIIQTCEKRNENPDSVK